MCHASCILFGDTLVPHIVYDYILWVSMFSYLLTYLLTYLLLVHPQHMRLMWGKKGPEAVMSLSGVTKGLPGIIWVWGMAKAS